METNGKTTFVSTLKADVQSAPIDAIRTGGKPIEDVRFGHHAALVGHMCNLSYKSGRPVRWNKATRKVEA